MLSKTKSKQILKLKYILLVPMVFGMLLYTSAIGQEKMGISKSNLQSAFTQELSDAQLKEKLYKELIEFEKNSKGKHFSYKNYIKFSNKYIQSREEYFRHQIYYEHIFKQIGESKVTSVEFFGAKTNRNYVEYLEWKKTDEAKEIWENNSHDGVLRLVVNDFRNLTRDEKIKEENKKELLFRDDFFHKLLITDGKGSYTIGTNKKQSSELEDIEVPFAVIDQVPLFLGCETLSIEEQKECTSDKITKHVQQNFNTDLAANLGLKGRQRISVVFKINKEGNIVGVRSRAPHPRLEEEAIRAIQSLPKMIPGKQNGETVIVPYSLPIIFQVASQVVDGKQSSTEVHTIISKGAEHTIISQGADGKQTSTEELSNGKGIPFYKVDEAPVFPGCEAVSTNNERKKCVTDKITKFVQKKFNTDLAGDLGLTGKQRISVVFQIDKNGDIVGVRSRAPHPRLEEEAKRVIGLLPKMKPGKHRGENVIVSYSLPIIFQLQE